MVPASWTWSSMQIASVRTDVAAHPRHRPTRYAPEEVAVVLARPAGARHPQTIIVHVLIHGKDQCITSATKAGAEGPA